MIDYSNSSIQTKMEQILSHTCGSFENCTQANIQTFLTQCYEENIDPQYCLNWVSEHNAEIPNWTNVLKISQEWINGHTSSGSAFLFDNELK